jgi:hypothetical protein
MQTYWLSLGTKKAASSSGHSEGGTNSDCVTTEATSMSDEDESKQDRLVDWMVELLVERLRPMVRSSKYVALFLKLVIVCHVFFYKSSNAN